MISLEGRTAVVTGAGRGIGRAVAGLLIREGVNVLAFSRTRSALEILQAEEDAGPGRCAACPGDVTSEDDVRRAFEEASAFGTPDILVNAAGLALFGPLGKCSFKDWNDLIGANLTGAFLMCREAVRVMGSEGHIVNIGSLAGFTPFTNSAAYCASKYGLVGLTRALSMELRAEGREGLKVTMIHPGSTDTSLWDGQNWSPPAHDMLRADDVAGAVLYALKQPPNASVDELRLLPVKGIL